MKPLIPDLKSKILNLPHKPGVYRFLDKSGSVLYIGKAKNLRARVRQYFARSDGRPQIPFLMQEAVDFDYTIVDTELESLYLERTLIQKHHPKYNIELKDDKSYAFIVIDYSTEIPQIIVARKLEQELRIKDKGLRINYFGPFTSAKKIRDLIFTARRTFGLCSAAKIGKPCFYFHLHRCPGVCAGMMTIENYKKHLDKIKLLFSGKITPTIKTIRTEMQIAAKRKKFEAATRLRDQLKALEYLDARQNVIMAKPVNWDIVGLAHDEGFWCVNLFKIRQGKMLDKENFVYQTERDEGSGMRDQNNVTQNFLEDYYSQTSDAPKEIMLPTDIENSQLIKTLIKGRFGKSVNINIPKKGKAKNLIKLSQTNSEEHLKNYLNEKAGHLDKIQRGLAGLKEILNLDKIPKRIEGFDISNTQGTNPVGSMVVFIDGLPKKSEYRKFKIQSKDTPDDFTMMKEMLGRRLQHLMEHKTWNIKHQTWPAPDLIVIDGGKGQLSAALSVLSANPLALSPKVIGLAKRIEEIFVPNKKEPIILPRDNPTLQLLQRLRDEAHRFGITFHRKLRSKQAVRSALDDIPGIGPKTKKLLKAKFGTVANIRKTNLEELSQAVGEKLARIIKQNL